MTPSFPFGEFYPKHRLLPVGTRVFLPYDLKRHEAPQGSTGVITSHCQNGRDAWFVTVQLDGAGVSQALYQNHVAVLPDDDDQVPLP